MLPYIYIEKKQDIRSTAAPVRSKSQTGVWDSRESGIPAQQAAGNESQTRILGSTERKQDICSTAALVRSKSQTGESGGIHGNLGSQGMNPRLGFHGILGSQQAGN
jgi:hypothetical protein